MSEREVSEVLESVHYLLIFINYDPLYSYI